MARPLHVGGRMKKNLSKLSLERTTVRALSPQHLGGVNGGLTKFTQIGGVTGVTGPGGPGGPSGGSYPA
jgi:hypothetical protein